VCTNAIELNFVINSYSVMDDVFRLVINEFNRYSKENNLNIDLHMTYFIDQNNTQGYNFNDYEQTLSLFGKRINMIYLHMIHFILKSFLLIC